MKCLSIIITYGIYLQKIQRPKQGTAVDGHLGIFQIDAIGRIYTVHPNNAECFHLQFLLVNINDSKSFQELRAVTFTLGLNATSAHPQQI